MDSRPECVGPRDRSASSKLPWLAADPMVADTMEDPVVQTPDTEEGTGARGDLRARRAPLSFAVVVAPHQAVNPVIENAIHQPICPGNTSGPHVRADVLQRLGFPYASEGSLERLLHHP